MSTTPEYRVEYNVFANANDNRICSDKYVRQTVGEMLRWWTPRQQNQKDGPAIIGATFLSPTGGRKDANVGAVTIVQYDFDNKGIDGQPAEKLTTVADLQSWLRRVKWPALIYETFSSKPDWPKFRVAFPLARPFVIRTSADDPQGAANTALYKRIYQHIGDGSGEAYDRSCSNLARLFYLPAYSAKPGAFEFFDGVAANA